MINNDKHVDLPQEENVSLENKQQEQQNNEIIDGKFNFKIKRA